jgi:hypothetical protein
MKSFDAGASLHLSKCASANTSMHKDERVPRKERRQPSHFEPNLKF